MDLQDDAEKQSLSAQARHACLRGGSAPRGPVPGLGLHHSWHLPVLLLLKEGIRMRSTGWNHRMVGVERSKDHLALAQ